MAMRNPSFIREGDPLSSSARNVEIEIQEGPFGGLHREGTGERPQPGVVLIHDVWGRSEHSRALATDVAREGFAVLEIDLYRALDAGPVEDPGERIRSLRDPDVIADLEASADWLADQPASQGRGIGVMGVCMGGTYALLAACLSDRFAAAAPFYGLLSYDHGMLVEGAGRDRAKKPLSPIEAADRLRTPLLASFGREDGFVPEADVDALASGLAKSGVSFEIDRYDGAGHAFLNRTREDAYHPASSSAAWARVVPFLHARLD